MKSLLLALYGKNTRQLRKKKRKSQTKIDIKYQTEKCVQLHMYIAASGMHACVQHVEYTQLCNALTTP